MKNFIFILTAIMLFACVSSSCTSKADKQKDQQVADLQSEDSIQKVQREEELKDEKIAFLKRFYENVIYPKDDNTDATDAFAKNFTRHLSEKVEKALTDYDSDIEDGAELAKNNSPQYYLLGDEGDYGNEGPKMTYIYEGDGWFKISIGGTTTLRVKVDSDKDDDENFIITGLDIPNYNLSVKP